MAKHAKPIPTRIWIISFAVLLSITTAAVSVTAWALLAPKTQVLMPDYAPQAEDKNAVSIPNEAKEEKVKKPEGGSSMSVTYSPEATISLSQKKVSLMFQNPSRSNSDMILMLMVQDAVLAESGKLVPGKMIQSLDLIDGAEKKLQPGTYNTEFIVKPYDPENAEKAMVDSKCAVTVTVLP